MLSNRRDGFFSRASEYASVQDFWRIFHQDMNVLYWLARTLTDNEREAEQCFVAAVEECIGGNSVFEEWARSWSRRVVIKSAIRLASPRPNATRGAAPGAIQMSEKPGAQAEAAQVALSNLRPFDRFVFVMTVLEGYADRDCVTLLECSARDLIKARFRAVRQIRRSIGLSPALREHQGSTSQQTLVDEAQAA